LLPLVISAKSAFIIFADFLVGGSSPQTNV